MIDAQYSKDHYFISLKMFNIFIMKYGNIPEIKKLFVLVQNILIIHFLNSHYSTLEKYVVVMSKNRISANDGSLRRLLSILVPLNISSVSTICILPFNIVIMFSIQ